MRKTSDADSGSVWAMPAKQSTAAARSVNASRRSPVPSKTAYACASHGTG
jgi:hypothetical protein